MKRMRKWNNKQWENLTESNLRDGLALAFGLWCICVCRSEYFCRRKKKKREEEITEKRANKP